MYFDEKTRQEIDFVIGQWINVWWVIQRRKTSEEKKPLLFQDTSKSIHQRELHRSWLHNAQRWTVETLLNVKQTYPTCVKTRWRLKLLVGTHSHVSALKAWARTRWYWWGWKIFYTGYRYLGGKDKRLNRTVRTWKFWNSRQSSLGFNCLAWEMHVDMTSLTEKQSHRTRWIHWKRV